MEGFTNFLEETEIAIKDSGHNTDDVMFIGTADGDYRINWNEFVKIANFEYDSGYGCAEIPTDLIVYFKDNTYMFRWEYDGSEWWEYLVRKIFKETDDFKPFKFKVDDESCRFVTYYKITDKE